VVWEGRGREASPYPDLGSAEVRAIIMEQERTTYERETADP